MFILCWKIPLFYHQCNILDVKNSEADWTQHDNSRVSFESVQFTLGWTTPIQDFPVPSLPSGTCLDAWIHIFLIYGLQWYVGWHLSIDINFLNSSLCHERQHQSHHLCMVFRLFKHRNLSATLNAVHAQPHSPVSTAHVPTVSVPSPLEYSVTYGCLLLIHTGLDVHGLTLLVARIPTSLAVPYHILHVLLLVLLSVITSWCHFGSLAMSVVVSCFDLRVCHWRSLFVRHQRSSCYCLYHNSL